MKESEFIKLNFKFEFSNSCANVKVKITSLGTAVRQLANTLTVREFSKWIVSIHIYSTSSGTNISIFKEIKQKITNLEYANFKPCLLFINK
jgi:hypothetical protein